MTDRRGKLFRKKVWALVLNGSDYIVDIEDTEASASFLMQEDSRVIPVMVSELPKPSRKKVKRGK